MGSSALPSRTRVSPHSFRPLIRSSVPGGPPLGSTRAIRLGPCALAVVQIRKHASQSGVRLDPRRSCRHARGQFIGEKPMLQQRTAVYPNGVKLVKWSGKEPPTVESVAEAMRSFGYKVY